MKRLLLIIALAACPAFGQLIQTSGTGSHNFATVYQNTTGKNVLVGVWATVGWNGSANQTDISLTISVDAVNPPVVTPCQKSSDVGKPAGAQIGCTVIVPPLSYYEANASSATGVSLAVAQWTESALTQLATGTQSNVTGSRNLGTIYQNASATNTIWVEVNATTSGLSSDTTLSAVCDSSATPTTNVGQETTFGGKSMYLMFPVLPLYYYKVSQDNGATVNTWAEVTTPTPLNMTQNVVTGSRSLSSGASLVVYQPATNAVLASITSTYTGIQAAGSTGAYSDTTNPPGYIMYAQSRHSSENSNLLFGVPVNYFYASNFDNTYTLVQWVEWDIPLVATSFVGEPRRRVSN